jgi:hypothetical protein
MRSSIHIAVTAAIALAASMFVVLLLTMRSSAHLADLLAPIAGGLLVGLGTYIGSRWAPPYQRSARLAHVLGVLFFSLGVVLTFPHETHAVKMDNPVAGGATSSADILIDIALALIAASAVVLFSMLITRGIAALCRPRYRGEN